MLYERARQLKSGGASSEEIRQALMSQGASEEDIKVVLGSLAEGPQPQPDPTQKPLALMSRVANSRGLRVVGVTVAAVGLAGIGYAGWVGVSFLLALFEGFRAGR